MRKFGSISDSKDFSKLYKDAKKWYCEAAVVFYLEDKEEKMAVVASKKVGKAVQRNRAKRLLREIFYHLEDELKSGQYIFVAKSELLELPFSQLEKTLKWSLEKLKCFKTAL